MQRISKLTIWSFVLGHDFENLIDLGSIVSNPLFSIYKHFMHI